MTRCAALAVAFALLVLPGCVTSSTTDVFANPDGRPESVGGGFTAGGFGFEEVPEERPRNPDAARELPDPHAPNLTLNGARAGGTTLLIRERAIAPEYDGTRYMCGGAALGVTEGSPDPRTLLVERGDEPAALTYGASFAVVDEAGRNWTTDRYDAADDPANRSRSVWVANVGGALAFRPDDGRSHCEPRRFGDKPYNAVLYFMELEGRVDLYFSPLARPAEPAERAFWPSTPPEPWRP